MGYEMFRGLVDPKKKKVENKDKEDQSSSDFDSDDILSDEQIQKIVYSALCDPGPDMVNLGLFIFLEKYLVFFFS